MFNEILNHKVNPDLLRVVEREEGGLLSRAEHSTPDAKLRLLQELKEELEQAVLPSLRNVEEIESLESWLNDHLIPRFTFNLSDEPYVLEKAVERKDLSKDLFSRYREIVALELLDFFESKGLAAVKRCDSCGGFFLWDRKDQKYCSVFCKGAEYRARKGQASA